ncbi:glyoxalase superfamily protein [Propionivibrio sp.]|uniref:glyoxalase superfamily protein n=1 Tax=Propionivibrio sp. TaxID=2212460 RepID=UPI0039E5BEB5
MSSQFSANSSNHVPLSVEASAAALWTFIKARSPHFTFESAVDLFQELNPSSDEDHKQLARRLAQALTARGIKIKHSNALQAIARLSGNGSWHTCDQPTISRLRFFAFDTDQTQESKFASWNELSAALRTWTDRL